MISTDKHKIPKKIIEIASKLNLGIYYPKKDIPLNKKKKFYTDYKLKTILKNNHEIDAYISAYFALMENRDIFRKAKKLSKNHKEYIEILRISFKNRNLEPASALEILKEFEKEKITSRKKRLRKKLNYNKNVITEFEDIDLQSKVDNYKNENNIELAKEYYKKYVSLLNDYNVLSKILVTKIKEDSDIVPKISFLIKNNIKSPVVFIDVIDKEVLSYLSQNNPTIFITEDKINNLPQSQRKVFLVKEYVDLKNFIILKKFEKYDRNFEDNIDIEKIKKLIDSLR